MPARSPVTVIGVNSSINSLTLTKDESWQVGDVMTVDIAYGSGIPRTINAPSGWTSTTNISTTNIGLMSWWKILSENETSWTWTWAPSTTSNVAILLAEASSDLLATSTQFYINGSAGIQTTLAHSINITVPNMITSLIKNLWVGYWSTGQVLDRSIISPQNYDAGIGGTSVGTSGATQITLVIRKALLLSSPVTAGSYGTATASVSDGVSPNNAITQAQGFRTVKDLYTRSEAWTGEIIGQSRSVNAAVVSPGVNPPTIGQIRPRV